MVKRTGSLSLSLSHASDGFSRSFSLIIETQPAWFARLLPLLLQPSSPPHPLRSQRRRGHVQMRLLLLTLTRQVPIQPTLIPNVQVFDLLLQLTESLLHRLAPVATLRLSALNRSNLRAFGLLGMRYSLPMPRESAESSHSTQHTERGQTSSESPRVRERPTESYRPEKTCDFPSVYLARGSQSTTHFYRKIMREREILRQHG